MRDQTTKVLTGRKGLNSTLLSSFVAVDGSCDLHILKGTSTEDQVCAAIPNQGCDKVQPKLQFSQKLAYSFIKKYLEQFFQ